MARTTTPPLPIRSGARGWVDGGWLPSTEDLEHELPELLRERAPRTGSIERVIYRLDEWNPAPKHLRFEFGRVHLDGYNRQPRHTVCLLCSDASRMVILVVPVSMARSAGRTVVENADRPGTMDTVQQLLGLTLTDVAPFTDPAVAQQRWDTDGGPQDSRQREFAASEGPSTR